MTMQFISSTTVTNTSTTVISFSNIPQTFTHLQAKVFIRSRSSAIYDAIYLTPYSTNTGVNGAYHSLYGTGTAVGANGYTAQAYVILGYIPAANAGSNCWGVGIIDFLDYTNSNKNKTVRGIYGWDDNGATSGQPYLGINSALLLGLGTNPIAGLRFIINTAFESGTRIDLYGINTSGETGA